MYLFFDTETTGLPKNYQAPLDDFLNWPRLVQLAWSLYDAEGNHWGSYNYIIKPDGFVIPEESTKIHRISQEKALKEGRDIKEILAKFLEDVKKTSYVIAHNIDFDKKIVGSEMLRNNLGEFIIPKEEFCTMKSSVNVCRIDNGRGFYKWPSLAELHRYLFNKDFVDAHDAMVDVNACAKCFFELKKRQLI